MHRYRYTATTEEGRAVRGELHAETEELARLELQRENLDVERIAVVKNRKTSLAAGNTRVARAEVMRFSRELAAFVRAGIPITEGFRVIASSATSRHWRRALFEMRDVLAEGVQLSDALAAYEDVFPAYYLGVIQSAEMTGRLDIALDLLSSYIERDLETRSKLKTALLYPGVVLAMAIVTVCILTGWVLPKFATFFKSLHTKLPATTRLLVSIADVAKRAWWLLPVAFVVTAAFALWATRTNRGRSFMSEVALRIPVVRGVVRLSAVERTCRVLAAMTSSGVPISDAMSATIRSSSNGVFAKGLMRAQEQMLEGDGLAEPLAATGLFPEGAVEMIRVGESTGTLEVQLDAVADFYVRELDFKLRRLTTVFEPAILLAVGLIVGFVAIALVQAMYGAYHAPMFQH